jgi:hypothetical protein
MVRPRHPSCAEPPILFFTRGLKKEMMVQPPVKSVAWAFRTTFSRKVSIAAIR